MKPEEIELEKQRQIKLLFVSSSDEDKAKLAKYLHTEDLEVDHVNDRKRA